MSFPQHPSARRAGPGALLFPVFVVLIGTLSSGPLFGQVTGKEYHEAVKELARAGGEVDAHGFLDAFRTVLQLDDARALRTAAKAYSTLAPKVLETSGPGEFVWFHGKAAAAFRTIKSASSVKEFRKLLAKDKSWHVRLLLLNASGFSKPIKLLESCLGGLKDKSPVVVRRALYYLRRAKTVDVVARILDAYLKTHEKHSKSSRRTPEALQWERTLLCYQSTLREMLKISLSSPEDYKNYFDSHRSDPNLFTPERALGTGSTGLTLFGAAITGKNIVFVLDTSGSMLSTDPRPEGMRDSGRRRTGVGDPSSQPDALQRRLERERMYRAKKELSKVVRALPYDVRFNIVDFSSEARSWNKSMLPATDANKKSAVKYIGEMEAEGITVTDIAMEEAFSDLNVDTIYLVTDGAPTHVGSSGRAKPPDADRLIREILQRVKELNFLRGVRVFTLGFKGAEENFLKDLAGSHSGEYVAIQ